MVIAYFIISLSLHLAIVIISLINSIKFYKIFSITEPTTKKIFISLCLYFLVFAVSYILRIIMVFVIPTDLTMFYEEIVYDRTEATHNIAVIYAFSVYIAMMILSTIVERALFKLKTKFIFSFIIIGSCLFIGLMLLISAFTYYDATHLQVIPLLISFIISIIFSVAYFWIGLRYRGAVQKKSIFIGSGVIINALGLLFSSKGVIQFDFLVQIIISPILILISVILLRIGYAKEV